MEIFVDKETQANSKGSIGQAFFVCSKNFEASMIFTTRFGGHSEKPYESLNLSHYVGDSASKVNLNRQKIALMLGVEEFYTLKQVHGSRVVDISLDFVKRVKPGHLNIEGDAILIYETDACAGVLTADCLPAIVVAEPGIVAAVHLGWRGLKNGILEETVRKMKQLGASEFSVFFGPSICAKCYEVGYEVASQFEGFREGIFSVAGKWYLSLKSIGFKILKDLGVAQEMVDVVEGGHIKLKGTGVVYNTRDCTFEDARYFSFRREKITGRQAAIVNFKRR